MAVSVTGVGERVMLSLLAKTVGEALAASTDAVDTVCQSVMRDTVLQVLPVPWNRDQEPTVALSQGPAPRDCGVIVVRVHPAPNGLTVECAAVHCSRSMGVACWHVGMDAPYMSMLRRGCVGSKGGIKRDAAGDDREPWVAWGCQVNHQHNNGGT